MDYKEAYYSLIERLKEAKEDNTLCDERYCCVIDGLIQEPEENEGIRGTLIDYFKTYKKQEECGIKTFFGIPTDNVLAWLEKQGIKPQGKSALEAIEEEDEHKELKKIETVDIPLSAKDSELIEATYFIPEGFHAEIVDNKVIIKKGEQKPAWSEEDEAGFGDALWAIQQARTIAKDENDMGNLWYAEKWLNSLKERAVWKPSEEQIKAVRIARSFVVDDFGEHPETSEIIIELEEQLKKLLK